MSRSKSSAGLAELLLAQDPNLGYVDELYATYLEDPNSVSEAWREFFADYRPAPERMPQTPPAPGAAPATPTAERPVTPEAPSETAADGPESEPEGLLLTFND